MTESITFLKEVWHDMTPLGRVVAFPFVVLITVFQKPLFFIIAHSLIWLYAHWPKTDILFKE